MPESSRIVFDSKGRRHELVEQQYSMSCGPACIAMVETYYKSRCMISPEGRAQVLSQRFPGSFDLEKGTQLSNIHEVLLTEGIKAYIPVKVPPDRMLDYLSQYASDRTPAIVDIAWNSGNHHVVVCRWIETDQIAVFLDPMGRVVEVPGKDLPRFNASGRLSGWCIFTFR